VLKHLDDPSPHDYPDDFRTRVHDRARSLRARRRIAAVSATVLVIVALSAGGLYARALSRINDVDRLTVAGTGEPVSEARTVLVAGIDGDLGGPVRTDTLLVVRLEGGRASVLSIPRDLVIPAPGRGEPLRANSIAADHGYDGLLQALDDALGVDVDNVVEIDFGGFARLVDLVGGIDVQLAAPVRDQMSGLAIEHAGCHRLDGSQALALARSRLLQHSSDGRWRTDPTGDLGRIARQPVLLTAGLQALTRTRPDPLTADRLAGWLVDHAAVDETLDNQELLAVLRAVMDLAPADVSFTTLPVEDHTLDNGAAVLRATDDGSQAIENWQLAEASAAFSQGDLITPCNLDEPEPPTSVTVGEPAPALAGSSLLGGEFDLSKQRGRHVVIALMASWCAPCIEDLPLLVEFAEGRPDVAMVSVAMGDDASAVTDLFEAAGGSWALLDDADGALTERLGFNGVPAYVIVEPGGTIGGTVFGSISTEQLEELTR